MFYTVPTTNSRRMKLLLLALSFSFISMTGLAQETINTDLIQVDSTTNPVGWVTYIDDTKFSIEYRFVNCDPNMGFDYEGVILRVRNKTSQKLSFSWHKILHYAGACRTCNFPDEYHYDLSVEPNQTVEGDCDPQSGYDLKLFSKFNDATYSQGDQLTAFKLGDFSVTQY